MINGMLLTEKLLIYANQYLELNDEDIPLKRNLLLYLLKADYEIVAVTESDDFLTLKSQLLDYITKKQLVDAKYYETFAYFVFSVLLPLPSKVDKKFRTLREKFGADEACDYLHDLALRSGQISQDNLNDLISPYSTFNGLQFYTYKKQVVKKPIRLSNYPKCSICKQNEGFFGTDIPNSGSIRCVNLTLNGIDFDMRYTDVVYRKNQMILSTADHDLKLSFREFLVAMLDYIEYLPKYVAEVYLSGKSDFIKLPHSYFLAGETPSAFDSVKPDFTVYSDLYKDVEISVYNANLSTIRLKSFNRNTLENVAFDILEKWQDYSDLAMGIFGRGNDGISHNNMAISVSYSNDNRYSIYITFTCEKVDPDFAKDQPTIFDKMLDSSFSFGNILLDKSVLTATELITACLTKKIPIDESLFAENGKLFGYKEIVDSLISENGYQKDETRAENLAKHQITANFVHSITKNSAFLPSDDGVRAFRRFLATVEIR